MAVSYDLSQTNQSIIVRAGRAKSGFEGEMSAQVGLAETTPPPPESLLLTVSSFKHLAGTARSSGKEDNPGR